MVTVADSSLIIGYLAVVLAIGWWSGRKQTSGDFMIAERKRGPLGGRGREHHDCQRHP